VKKNGLFFFVFLLTTQIWAMEEQPRDTDTFKQEKNDFNCKVCLCTSMVCLGLSAWTVLITGVTEGHVRPLDSYTDDERNQIMLNSTAGCLGCVLCCDELRKLHRKFSERPLSSQKME
jgi:hypothetical protein